MVRNRLFILVFWIILFVQFISSSSAEIIYINDSNVYPENQINVPILINVTDPYGLGAVQINLTFNSSVVKIIAANDSDFEIFVSPNINNQLGYANMGAYQINSSVGPGIVQFINLTFEAALHILNFIDVHSKVTPN